MSNNIIYHYIIEEHCEYQIKSFVFQLFVMIPLNQYIKFPLTHSVS